MSAMGRQHLFSFPALFGVAAFLALARTAAAVTPAELQKQIAGDERLTIIDVRSPTFYARGHIPGAINVPASLCSQKKLPPLGKVVVYDDGLGLAGAGAAETAAAELGRQPGISTDILEGGFAAWESAHNLTTRGKGAMSETLNYVTYAQLKAAKADDVVLVDLRKRPAPVAASQSGGTNFTAITDLSLGWHGRGGGASPQGRRCPPLCNPGGRRVYSGPPRPARTAAQRRQY
jgi:rhodanese-related sulfurtransferase